MVVFEDVSVEREGRNVLKNVSFRVERGEFAAVLGANGAGKTTLLKLLNALLLPTCGRVLINGVNTRTTRTSALAKTVGFLFQNPDSQLCKNTVREEIAFGLTNIGKSKEYVIKKCEEVISEFGFSADKPPFCLSRGERQMLALASVAAAEPELLVLDEPTTGLDARSCGRIMRLIRGLNARGTTVVMVTHDMELALEVADSALVLADGTLKGSGSIKQVMKNKELMSAARLLPAEIPALAQRLDAGFESVFTAAEMLESIANRRKHEGNF